VSGAIRPGQKEQPSWEDRVARLAERRKDYPARSVMRLRLAELEHELGVSDRVGLRLVRDGLATGKIEELVRLAGRLRYRELEGPRYPYLPLEEPGPARMEGRWARLREGLARGLRGRALYEYCLGGTPSPSSAGGCQLNSDTPKIGPQSPVEARFGPSPTRRSSGHLRGSTGLLGAKDRICPGQSGEERGE
jgi:hypothetical protein